MSLCVVLTLVLVLVFSFVLILVRPLLHFVLCVAFLTAGAIHLSLYTILLYMLLWDRHIRNVDVHITVTPHLGSQVAQVTNTTTTLTAVLNATTAAGYTTSCLLIRCPRPPIYTHALGACTLCCPVELTIF